jgi:quinoprotein glucose dehydrogenase
LCFSTVCAVAALQVSADSKSVELGSHPWVAYGGDLANTKYSPLDQIDATNVASLETVWRWSSPDNAVVDQHPDLLRFPFESTPLVIGGVLYTSTALGQVVALDPATGETRWVYDPKAWEREQTVHSTYLHRGVSHWSDGDDSRIIYGTPDAYLIALDTKTGKPTPSFGAAGKVDLTKGLRRPIERKHYGVSSPPVIVGDVIVVGSSITDAEPERSMPPGDVRGFDVRTGEQLWVFRSIPQEGEFGHETWEGDSWKYTGNTNVWTVMSADPELGYVYLPFSTPTNDWYGGARHGDNLFAESLVCLDAKTGKRVWHFQMVHHGLWDYDLASAPNLVDIEILGRPIKAVAQVSKQGFTYVFDRVTGEPVWPIEERAVPQSKFPGEKSAPTQPFPSKPPPFERQGITPDDLISFTPELRREALEILKRYDYGPLFAPPTEGTLLQLPGPLGGANWTGAAFDPETRLLYVPSITWPGTVELTKPDPEVSDLPYIHEVGFAEGPQGLPLLEPPYGRVTAIDLQRGEIVWVAPLGDGPLDHPALAGLDLPRLGWNHRGAPLLTKTLLFVGQEARHWHYFQALLDGDVMDAPNETSLSKFHPKLYAFDKATGEQIWQTDLPANVMGAPMTYMVGGKQYVTFPIGGVRAPAGLVSLSLP